MLSGMKNIPSFCLLEGGACYGSCFLAICDIEYPIALLSSMVGASSRRILFRLDSAFVLFYWRRDMRRCWVKVFFILLMMLVCNAFGHETNGVFLGRLRAKEVRQH